MVDGEIPPPVLLLTLKLPADRRKEGRRAGKQVFIASMVCVHEGKLVLCNVFGLKAINTTAGDIFRLVHRFNDLTTLHLQYY